MVCLDSDIDSTTQSQEIVTSYSPGTQLQDFRTWLQKYHPGFCNLPESEQLRQCSRFFSVYIHEGVLPPLPVPDSRIRIHPGKYAVPLEPVHNILYNLKTQLIDAFFKDPKFSNYTRIVFNTVHQCLMSNQIDSLVSKFLILSLTEMADHLDAIYHFHLNLISHSLQYYLLKTNVAHSDITSIINASTQIFIQGGYRLVGILFKPDLLEDFIRRFDPFLVTVPSNLKSLIADTIRLSCSIDSIFDMIDNLLYSVFCSSSTPWEDIQVETFCSDFPSGPHTPDTTYDAHQNSRISNLSSLSRSDSIQLFLRLFIPNTAILFQGSVQALCIFLTDSDSDYRKGIMTSCQSLKPVPSRCTYLDLQIIDL